jgi:hypothetical protein
MDDEDGPQVAEWVYQALVSSPQFDLDDIAYALDDATSRLRASGVPASRWSVFIHMGA